MAYRSISRRNALLAGCSVVGLGLWSVATGSNDGLPGTDNFTAGTVPAASDPLLWFSLAAVRDDPASTALATALLDSDSFAGVPEPLTTVFGDTEHALDPASIGQLAVVGSNAGPGAAAVAWADWSEDDRRGALQERRDGTLSTGQYEDRTIYSIGDTGGVQLADHVSTWCTRSIRSTRPTHSSQRWRVIWGSALRAIPSSQPSRAASVAISPSSARACS